MPLPISFRCKALRSLSLAGAALMMTAALPSHAEEEESGGKLTTATVPSTPIAGEFSFAAVGDLIYLRPMLATIEKQSPDMLAILRGADVTFANFETTALDLKTFKGSPQAESGGTWMLADPAVPGDVAKMGVDIVGHANNHATDWGVEGLYDTLDLLDDAHLVHAGTGRSMTAARAPAYFDGPHGRVGLISATTSFTPMSPASDPLGQVPGRGGANAIRSTEIGLVSDADLATIARLAGTKAGAPVKMKGREYRATATPATPMTIEYDLNAKDVNANLLAVRQAHQNGNFTVFSLHNHEPGNAFQTPANFAPTLAHQAIDAGADVYVGHGPHQLRGIEIYKGKPIFYSLGNFAMMNNSLDDLPADMYDQFGITPGSVTAPELLQARGAKEFGDPNLYETVIAVSQYKDGKLSEIRLYPVDLGVNATGAGRGVPHLADATVGARILARLQRLSQPFGTHIDIARGIGIIRVSGSN
ncbi:poly-gamma-glutamate synthesis protein (capsule biosynthesis protein) [Sphingobium sp. AP50]|uniref:CapA family protein n=1 Tax=Sphingobium sp. AP50 TaxID=1884369 RepID=UPI0008D499A2|nr:CapA family protein [Sphingobium sp. AP50]SEJ93334.1 poly-gamma-glutamate synthesis protein (capsule biosynthesis protein) [Sphingobium sp. AP50]